MRILDQCPTCKETAVEVSHSDFGDYKFVKLKCGHFVKSEHVGGQADQVDQTQIKSLDGKEVYPFQYDGIKFCETAGLRAHIGDEQGLGKTIQACALIKLHHEKMTPCIIFTKAILRPQWSYEFFRWTGKPAQVIKNSSDIYIPAFGAIILSYDMAQSVKWLKDFPVKSVILDECQQIKNPQAQRTNAVRDICKRAEYIISLSGTAILNHAGEYYTLFNILDPKQFPSPQSFYDKYVDYYFNGRNYKFGGIRRDMLDTFRKITGEFVIRRLRKDVLPDLPKINRTYSYYDLSEKVQIAWQKLLNEYAEYYDGLGGETGKNMMGILEYLNKMRYLTGLAKIEPVADQVYDWINEHSDGNGLSNKKITIFHHHAAVGIGLYNAICQWTDELGINPPTMLNPNATNRDEIVSNCARYNGWFSEDPKDRILIASTLANSEGLNLQRCDTMIQVERQWNPGKEEQAESRFPRPGSIAQSISCNYSTAVGTIDEWLGELVERKRQYMKQTLGDSDTYKWDETSIIKDLAEICAKKGRKSWKPQSLITP